MLRQVYVSGNFLIFTTVFSKFYDTYTLISNIGGIWDYVYSSKLISPFTYFLNTPKKWVIWFVLLDAIHRIRRLLILILRFGGGLTYLCENKIPRGSLEPSTQWPLLPCSLTCVEQYGGAVIDCNS